MSTLQWGQRETTQTCTCIYIQIHTCTHIDRLIDRWIKSQVKCCDERTEIEQGRKYQGWGLQFDIGWTVIFEHRWEPGNGVCQTNTCYFVYLVGFYLFLPSFLKEFSA